MDLPYPTLKDDQLALNLSPSNRRGSLVIRDSRKKIPTVQNIEKGNRLKIVSLIEQDSPYELDQLIDDQVISLLAEVGREGSHETALHLSCRENSVKCIQYLCKRYYQDFPNEYQRWVNAQTKEGLTAVMICTLSQSDSALEYLLSMGGADIHLIDTNKLSAYQMALNCKNEKALKLLMEYENRSKRERTVNTAQLAKEIVLAKGKNGWCESLYKCLLDCLTCGGERASPRKKLKKVSLLVSGKTGLEGLFIDKVDLGFEQEELGVEFEWRLMEEFLEEGKDNRIFCNFSPYDMEDLNLPLSNYLTLCQSLSQTPWLARRIISSRSRGANYTLNFFQKHTPKSVSTDGYLPFVTRTNSPLFLSDRKEGWPMLLQKGLAKLFGSYKKLNSLGAKQLIETVTGWPALTISSSSEQFYEALKWFFKDKYMFILEGRGGSHLTPPQGGVATFTVLNFYQKEGKKLVLINCPFVDAAWMEKEKHETRALKVLRGYYNCREQMTIWVEAERLSQFFNRAIVVPLREGFQRESLQVAVSQRLFFKLELEEEEGEVLFYIADAETGRLILPLDLEGWRNEQEVARLEKNYFNCQGLQQLQGRPGQYFFTMSSGKGRLVIVSWASKVAKMEPLEQTFGLLQWTSCFRKNLYGRWDDSKEYVVEQTAGCTIVARRSQASQCSVKLENGGLEVLEGRLVDQDEVEMVREEGFFYLVVRGTIEGQPIFLQF